MIQFSAREVVSQSGIQDAIKKHWDFNIYNKELKSKEVRCDDILNIWKDNLLLQCEKFSKKIKLEFDNFKFLYNNVKDKNSYKAALISEIFRNKYITKNCANLDLHTLQNLLVLQIENKKIKFTIAWGHSKRNCGKLKTENYFADFAELYSISILFLIGKVANLLSGLPIEITILSGGLRFYNALFANLNEIEKYDEQRNKIAKFLCDDHVSIKFEKCKLDKMDLDKIDEISQNISEHSAKNKFNTILCNIDWKNIFTNDLYPHNIKIPKIIREISNIDILIAGSIASILNKKAKEYFENILNIETLNQCIEVMKAITQISTKKYLAIHILNKNIFSLKDYIRLSVHSKPDRNDIPAIYTLGVNGGNKLSQHNIMVIKKNSKIDFITNYEAKLFDYTKVINANNSCLFDWCDNNALFFIKNTDCNIANLIKSIKFINLNQ